MAAHPAVKAINTQKITDKARRDLLQLLEAVGEPHRIPGNPNGALIRRRFEARRTWSSKDP